MDTLLGSPDPILTSFENATGLPAEVWGIVLGTAIVAILWICLSLILADRKGRIGDNATFISAGLGVVVSTGIGWYPIWIPIFIAVLVFAVWIFGEKQNRGG